MMRIAWDSIAVGAIVLVAGVWAIRSIVRAVRAKKICATCASSGDCPLAGKQTLQDLEGLPGACPEQPAEAPRGEKDPQINP